MSDDIPKVCPKCGGILYYQRVGLEDEAPLVWAEFNLDLTERENEAYYYLERAQEIVSALCGGGHGYEIKINAEETERFIEIDGVAGVFWSESTRLPIPTISGRAGYRQGFQLYVVSYDPGVYRYADGSGQPPSADVDDVGEPNPSFDLQVFEALKLAMAKRHDNLLNGQ